MQDSNQQNRPSLLPPGAYLHTILPMVLGITVGRLAGDLVRESLGWWGSLAVGTLVAMGVGLAVYLAIQAVRRPST